MNHQESTMLLRELRVVLSILQSLEHTLENHEGITDFDFLSCLAGEGRRKVDDALCVLTDKL